MAEHQLPKLVTRVRFPSLAPYEDNKKDIVRENPGLIGVFAFLKAVFASTDPKM